MVRIENNRHMLEITCEVAFIRLFSVLAFYRKKWCKHGLIPTKLDTQHCLVDVIVLKWLELVTVLSFLFMVFLAFLGTFSHKMDQAWFVWNETWHKTLFGIYIIVLKWLESKR